MDKFFAEYSYFLGTVGLGLALHELGTKPLVSVGFILLYVSVNSVLMTTLRIVAETRSGR
jgi:hypothetical protein